MRVNQYKVNLTEDKIPYLVKEKGYNYSGSELQTPEAVVNLCNTLFDAKNDAEERIYMLGITSTGTVTGVFEISHGTVNSSLMSPREIFQRALLSGAVSIILAHNHPSGDTTPSTEDLKATKRIEEASKLMGVTLLDHVIIGENTYRSLKAENILSL